ncbi:hypothetical protein L9F63_004116, partial [Diploptera punctata]
TVAVMTVDSSSRRRTRRKLCTLKFLEKGASLPSSLKHRSGQQRVARLTDS